MLLFSCCFLFGATWHFSEVTPDSVLRNYFGSAEDTKRDAGTEAGPSCASSLPAALSPAPTQITLPDFSYFSVHMVFENEYYLTDSKPPNCRVCRTKSDENGHLFKMYSN